MEMRLHPLDFAQVSDIRVSYSGAGLCPGAECDILIASFSGEYRDGGEGYPDARYIHAMGQAGVLAWSPLAVMLDFSGLTYRWGDNLRDIRDIGEREFGIEGLPLAIVVGPDCESAVRSCFEVEVPGSVSEPKWIFREFEQAFAYLEGRFAEIDARFGGRRRLIPLPDSEEHSL